MHTYDITCPTFPGFYNSWLNGLETDNWEHELCGEPENWPDYVREALANCWWEGVDVGAYEESVAAAYCGYISGCLKDLGYAVTLTFEKVVRPKYYNFETDKAYCVATMDDDARQAVVRYVMANRKDWDTFIDSRHSSRSGYISFVSSKGEDWLKVLVDGAPDDDLLNQHKAMDEALRFILLSDKDGPDYVMGFVEDYYETIGRWTEYIDNAEALEYLNRELPDDKQLPEDTDFWDYLYSFETVTA